jgi:uncharacterized protein DUF6428
MKLRDLQKVLKKSPNRFPRFLLPNGDYVPAHAHVTEVGHLIRTFIDCGGVRGQEEKVVLQTHAGDDTEHRLRSDRFAKILQLGQKILPRTDLDVEVEYDCCVVAQYPVVDIRLKGDCLDLMLGRGRTQCRARERRETGSENCCSPSARCC